MRARTSRAAAIAIPLVIWLGGTGSTGADELGTAAGAPSEALSGSADSHEAGIAFAENRYQRILVSPLRIVYSDDPDLGQHHESSREIDPKDKLRFEQFYLEAIEKQLGKRYEMASEPGPDVLRVDTVLVDPVVDKSAWNAPARTVYSELQTVRLGVVLRDSVTEERLLTVDLPVRLGTSRWSEQNAVTYWSQVRLVFSRVAMRVQGILEGEGQPSNF